jgi:MoaA/NifB/PqqE/SkfB family radical SAM enzyme
MLERARAAGMTSYTVWGGEPLLVEDLPAWLHRARSLGMRTVVCTSGRRLRERAAEIGPGVDTLIVSLEAVGADHDRIRGVTGLFDEVAGGLSALRRHASGELLLWCNLSRENRSQAEAIARFAASQDAGVEFFPATEALSHDAGILLDRQERHEVFGGIMALKRRGLPVRNTGYALELMRSGRPFRCNVPALAIQVMADGLVYPCDPTMCPELSPYGHVSDVDLSSLRRSPAYLRARETLRDCNRCLGPCVAHMADNLVLQAVRRAANMGWYRVAPGLRGSRTP